MGPLEHSPEEIQCKINGNANVVGDKGLPIPTTSNTIKTIEKDYQSKEDARDIGKVWLEGRLERERVAVDSLSFECIVKAYVSDAYADPCEQSTCPS